MEFVKKMNQTEIDNRQKYLLMISELKDIYHKLNSWSTDFIEDIENKLCDPEEFLTEKQVEKLEEIYERYC